MKCFCFVARLCALTFGGSWIAQTLSPNIEKITIAAIIAAVFFLLFCFVFQRWAAFSLQEKKEMATKAFIGEPIFFFLYTSLEEL